MTIVIVVLRVLHILGAVFWAGASMALYFFVIPSAVATRPDSTKFMQHLTGMSRISLWMTLASLATVIGGLGMFDFASSHFNPDWMRSSHGIALSLGAVAGLLAFFEGQAVAGPTARKLGAIGKAVTAGGAPPTPEQAAQLDRLRTKLARVGTRDAVILVVAAVLMAAARYL